MDKSLLPGVILISCPRGQGLCLNTSKKKPKKEYAGCVLECVQLFSFSVNIYLNAYRLPSALLGKHRQVMHPQDLHTSKRFRQVNQVTQRNVMGALRELVQVFNVCGVCILGNLMQLWGVQEGGL